MAEGCGKRQWRLGLALLALATAECRPEAGRVSVDPRGGVRVAVEALSFSLPDGFVEKARERTREPLLIPGQFTNQVFARWEAPGERSFTVFYWSDFPPRDLGPMAAATEWKTTIAGQQAAAAETETFMGIKQRVLVAWLERPGGGRFMMYARNVPREAFDQILATMSWRR